MFTRSVVAAVDGRPPLQFMCVRIDEIPGHNARSTSHEGGTSAKAILAMPEHGRDARGTLLRQAQVRHHIGCERRHDARIF